MGVQQCEKCADTNANSFIAATLAASGWQFTPAQQVYSASDTTHALTVVLKHYVYTQKKAALNKQYVPLV